MSVGYSGYGIDVEHVAVRVAKSLSVKSLRVGLNGCLYRLEVVEIDDTIGDTLCAECVGDEIERTAIEIVGCHDVVASLCDVLDGIGDSGGTTRHGESSHTALKCSHTLFEHTLSAVGQSSVDITCITQTETVGSVLRIAEYITGGLIYRYRT